MRLKTTDSENQKSTVTPRENSVCCLVKCLIALASTGTKQVQKCLWRQLEPGRNVHFQYNTKPSWTEFSGSLFPRVREAHPFPSQVLPVTFFPHSFCVWDWALREEQFTVTSAARQATLESHGKSIAVDNGVLGMNHINFPNRPQAICI